MNFQVPKKFLVLEKVLPNRLIGNIKIVLEEVLRENILVFWLKCLIVSYSEEYKTNVKSDLLISTFVKNTYLKALISTF